MKKSSENRKSEIRINSRNSITLSTRKKSKSIILKKEESKLDLEIKLLNFEFMCDMFLEVYITKFIPSFQVIFQILKRHLKYF